MTNMSEGLFAYLPPISTAVKNLSHFPTLIRLHVNGIEAFDGLSGH
jgi:hypothetical protein